MPHDISSQGLTWTKIANITNNKMLKEKSLIIHHCSSHEKEKKWFYPTSQQAKHTDTN
jgi:hypothetical protein